jgi:hypothetical protein
LKRFNRTIIHPVAAKAYGSETSFLLLVKLFANRVPRKISVSERQEVTGE